MADGFVCAALYFFINELRYLAVVKQSNIHKRKNIHKSKITHLQMFLYDITAGPSLKLKQNIKTTTFLF